MFLIDFFSIWIFENVLDESVCRRRPTSAPPRRARARHPASLDVPLHLDDPSPRTGLLARGADRGADYVPDRLHHRPAGHLPFPQVRRGRVRGRYARRAGFA